jgi:hypothetical protein
MYNFGEGEGMSHYAELPMVNEKMFFMNKEVIVVKIIKNFNLAKVKYTNSNNTFAVDVHALTKNPDMTKTISIKVLGGIYK